MSKEMPLRPLVAGPAVPRFICIDDDAVSTVLTMGEAVACLPGVFVTLGSSSGHSLLEVTRDATSAVTLGAHEVVDVAQIAAGQLIQVGPRAYAVLMPLQTFVPSPHNRAPQDERLRALLATCAPGDRPIATISAFAERNSPSPSAAFPVVSPSPSVRIIPQPTPAPVAGARTNTAVVSLPRRPQAASVSSAPSRPLRRLLRSGIVTLGLAGGMSVGLLKLKEMFPGAESIAMRIFAAQNATPAQAAPTAAVSTPVSTNPRTEVAPPQQQAAATPIATASTPAPATVVVTAPSSVAASAPKPAAPMSADVVEKSTAAKSSPENVAAEDNDTVKTVSAAAETAPTHSLVTKTSPSKSSKPPTRQAKPAAKATPALDAATLAQNNQRLQELSLLAGFDPDKALKGLNTLAKEVPAGSPLSKKIHSEIAKIQP